MAEPPHSERKEAFACAKAMVRIAMAQQQIRWFGGANSEHGFISYYDELFSDLQYIYILKGGPGTGKSYLMRRCAEEAASRGIPAEEVYCSSDASSLDGVILREVGIGILDGTAPHMLDPDLPAVHGEILNLGAYWDKDCLLSHADNIRALCRQKAELYRKVYSMTEIYGKLKRDADMLVSPAVNTEKTESVAERMMRRFRDGAGFRLSTRQISSVGMWGKTEFTTLRDNAQHRISVSDKYETGHLFLRALIREARKKKLHTLVSYHPICTDREQELFFPELCLSVYVGSEGGRGEEKHINMQRFIDRQYIASHRNELRLRFGLEKELYTAIEALFVRIRETHFELETYYTNAMDFGKKSREDRAFLAALFDALPKHSS